MLKFNSNGVSLALIRDVRKKDAEQECPIRWRVTHQRKQVYYSTGIVLTPKEWELLNADSRIKEIKQYREALQNYFDDTIKKHVKSLAEEGSFSYDLLNVRLSKTSGNDLKQAFKSKIQQLVVSNSIGNANVYQCALRSIEDFSDRKISFSDITTKWLERYLQHMENKGLRYSTIGMYLRTLRAVVNDAKNANIINSNSYPFGSKKNGKFEIPSGGGRELSMNLYDIQKIAEHNCQSKTLEMCRDMWLFSFLCNGANFGDILRFKFSDIRENEIYFYRKKTKSTAKKKTEIIAPVLPEMKEIIDRWGNDTSDGKGFIFPFLNNCKKEVEYKHEIHNFIRLTNKKIKDITKDLNLPAISTYTARHSYATILAKKRVPESYISQALGHSASTVTQIYFGRYDKTERFNYNNLLTWKNSVENKLK